LIVPGLLLIFRAINVQLAHRDQRASGTVVIPVLLGHDVRVDRAGDRLIRTARLM
jgi:hypothetical protein